MKRYTADCSEKVSNETSMIFIYIKQSKLYKEKKNPSIPSLKVEKTLDGGGAMQGWSLGFGRLWGYTHIPITSDIMHGI